MLLNKFIVCISAFSLLFFAIGCSSAESTKQVSSGSFFDLKSFFNKELTRLEKINTVNKVIELNGQREERNISDLDFSKELILFSSSDINRIAWKDKYKVDSIKNDNGQLSALDYTALTDKMRTQSLYISFLNNEVDSIFINNKIIGLATQSQQNLHYVPKQGYSIHSSQSALVDKERSVFIQVEYID